MTLSELMASKLSGNGWLILAHSHGVVPNPELALYSTALTSMKSTTTMRLFTLIPLIACLHLMSSHAATGNHATGVADKVDATVRQVMEKYDIPGMAVAVTVNGKRTVSTYGVASRDSKLPVTGDTLFEIGSISKTFTATLAASAQIDGKLSLSDNTSKHLPSLRGSSFDNIQLLHLATHTSGGLPLQVPEAVDNVDQLIDYLKGWKPAHPAGAQRTYSNVSIGLLGMIAAQSMGESFERAMEGSLFPALGMTNSFINVPAGRLKDYAQGYTRKDVPVRLNPGVLAAEAYGVKTTAADLVNFVEANMQLVKLDEKLQRAVDETHKGHFKSGALVQGLIWERYPYPATLEQVLTGNSEDMIYKANASTRINPSTRGDALINKTGSTNGFAAYVAFVPARKIGVVILANKSYPIEARVTAGYRILAALHDARISGK